MFSAVQSGGYFMSKEAEDAAKWKAVELHEENKKHLVELKTALSEIGKEFEDFGGAIRRLDDEYSFEVGSQAISVGHRERQKMMAHLSKQHLDWDAICRLVSDYLKTRQALAESSSTVKGLGATP